MSSGDTIQQCPVCGSSGSGTYCSNCGHLYITKRITLSSMVHEVFHFFTHLDKGFPYTLKQLVRYPGKMQREYVAGYRAKHQKPFSMFFVCATVAALIIYSVNLLLNRYYNAGSDAEGAFFHQYWVLLQISLLPFYTLITYLFFRDSRLNFAEIGVLQLYLFSVLYLMIAAIHLFKFIVPDLETRFIEVPVTLIYTVLTNVQFFNNSKRGTIIVKSIIVIGICFYVASLVQDLLVGD